MPLSPQPKDFLSVIAGTGRQEQKVQLICDWILHEFDSYYSEFRNIAFSAEEAFEHQDFQTSIALSKRRLSVYSISVRALGPEIKAVCPELGEQESLWQAIEQHFLQQIKGRYEADLAFAYLHSVRRVVNYGEWKPVAYSFGEGSDMRDKRAFAVHWTYPVSNTVTVETIQSILDVPDFVVGFVDLEGDAAAIAARLNQRFQTDDNTVDIQSLEMIAAGFYRNRGAYLVGRIQRRNGSYSPFIIALLNSDAGIYVDAVLTSTADAHNLFSSTLANFHVTDVRYHELAEFLHSMMPTRPVGLHYSTIGFNHVGKVAVMNELQGELKAGSGIYRHSDGYRGSVAIGFTEPSSAYHLKVIRDIPTDQYKWGEYVGVTAVLDKYSRVHEINRTGSMLDNVIYFNIKLDRASFADELLDELLTAAASSVSLQGSDVIFKHLVVQRRLTPLPEFLKTAAPADAETAMINLGYCIKNNAAANIFNKDLDARNYGVNRFLKVYLFDYDALEPFTEVKIRTNQGYVDGEDDVPDWYFEDGVIFLPEEIESGLMLSDRNLRRRFREVHGDLLTINYWQSLQDDILNGHVPSIKVYPDDQRLLHPA